MDLINCTRRKEGAKKKKKRENYVYVYFCLSQKEEARERIKHLYYQCELLSDLSEPPQ